MFDLIFAFVHLLLLVGFVGYAFYLLFQGDTFRFVIILALLLVYYFLVLHKAVKREIERKRKK